MDIPPAIIKSYNACVQLAPLRSQLIEMNELCLSNPVLDMKFQHAPSASECNHLASQALREHDQAAAKGT